MKTMIAKYPGVCMTCHKPITRGESINFYGRGQAEHSSHSTPASQPAGGVVGACWICGDAAGKFRNLGAATPVWCDSCNATQQARTKTVCNVRFIPDRFDMEVEDRMAEQCGL